MSAPFPTFTSKIERLAFFKAKIATEAKWAIRALEVIYQYQTAAEKAQNVTTDHNGVGFSGANAEILSRFAQQVASWKAASVKKYKTPLSEKQVALLFKRMPSYAAQLIRHLEANGTLGPIVKPTNQSEVA